MLKKVLKNVRKNKIFDVFFYIELDEDHCRMRIDNSAENFAVLRHIATNLYKSFISSKLSLKAKRFRCSFDDDFLSSVIFNKFR